MSTMCVAAASVPQPTACPVRHCARKRLLQLQVIRIIVQNMRKRSLLAILLSATLAAPMVARAGDANFTLTIKDRKFDVAELDVPANAKFTLTVKNLDKVPSEFESSDLNREKVVVGSGTITVYLGPLTPGSYEFFDDFNPAARGHIVAK